MAFQASYTEVTTSGAVIQTGRIYRNSAGSESRDGQRAGDKGVEHWVIITNSDLGKRYELKPGQSEWDEYPLERRLTAGHNPPPRMSWRLRRGQGPTIDGMRSYVLETFGRQRQIVVPDLNFFAVQSTIDGNTTKFHNIERVEPSATVFRLPPNAKVRSHAVTKSELRGRVAPPPAMEERP